MDSLHFIVVKVGRDPPPDGNQASVFNFQVTPLFLYGGILLPLAIGAVVVGVPLTCHTPERGHFSPVFEVCSFFIDQNPFISGFYKPSTPNA